MKVGDVLAGQKKVLQIEKATQVHQLVTTCKVIDLYSFLDIPIRVWNNTGQIIPPMTLRELAVLNGDEYHVQVGFDFTAGTVVFVLTYEVCDEGSINRTVYVELDASAYSYDIELDSIDVTNTTAVKMRLYNLMNIVSPALLPKNSLCIMNYADILSLQKNNDLMGKAEIMTHSNCILRDGTLSEVHPVVYDVVNSVSIENSAFTQIAKEYVMGYDAANGKVIIQTGEDEFLLSPVSSGCQVLYCQKELTKIAQQVRSALISNHQQGNVDSQEFASAVASVGRVAQQQGLSTDQTQSVANKVVPLLPSVRIAKLSGVSNFNLASESIKETGLKKTL